MRIGVPKERTSGERRVAIAPEAVRKLVKRGHEVLVERGAGDGSRITDGAFVEAGASLGTREEAWSAEIVVKIDPPTLDEVALLPEGGHTISLLYAHLREEVIDALRGKKATCVALERIPRTSIAQSFDVLSSMANIAGYRAVIEGAAALGSFLGLQMTAAGKKPPARVLVIGAGVAGLAAIGAARALGADVRAFDTRPAVKEEVESLGATFLELTFEESGDGGGGYAKVMSKEFIDAEMALFLEQAPGLDIVITTALIPGRKAPLLWTKDHVEAMKPGSVVIDMAAVQGGNCELTKADEDVEHAGVRILGHTDLVSRMAPDASRFFGNNVVNLLRFLGNGQEEGVVVFNPEDRTVNPALSLYKGEDPPELEPLPVVEKAPPPVAMDPSVVASVDDWESEPRSGTQNQWTAPRIAALLCVAGFFLPWTGFAGHTASGYDILSTAFDLDQYRRGLVFGALPLLALLSAITDKRGLHIATGCYAVCLLGFGIMESTEVAQSLLRDPETAFKFFKIGVPLTFGGALAQLLSISGRDVGSISGRDVGSISGRDVGRWLFSLLASVGLLALGVYAPTDLIQHLTVFVLACFIGWQVIWNVNAALHTPLMAVTNAISGIILVGGMLQAGASTQEWAIWLGVVAILFASINVVGGFLVTHRMLKMFRKG